MSHRYRLTVDTSSALAPHVEAYLARVADRFGARLTVSEYEDHPDYRVEIRNRTIRTIRNGRSEAI